MRRNLVGIDVNMAFAAGANGLLVGLAQAPTHVMAPVFDPKLPGAWLVDLSHVDLSRVKSGKEWVKLDGELLPSPFTPKGERPEGPAWYATPTVAYAQELGYDVTPTEAWVGCDNGRYLDGWYNRLRDAYIATMADLGVGADLPPQQFLAAMDGYRQHDPELAIVVSAIKATVKGGLGKLRERPRGEGWKPGEPWRALARLTWRPDIRAAIISRTRINMHRKIVKHAAFTGQYPVAILSDCAVYAADGASPLDFLPYLGLGRGERVGVHRDDAIGGTAVRRRGRGVVTRTHDDLSRGVPALGPAVFRQATVIVQVAEEAFLRILDEVLGQFVNPEPLQTHALVWFPVDWLAAPLGGLEEEPDPLHGVVLVMVDDVHQAQMVRIDGDPGFFAQLPCGAQTQGLALIELARRHVPTSVAVGAAALGEEQLVAVAEDDMGVDHGSCDFRVHVPLGVVGVGESTDATGGSGVRVGDCGFDVR